MNVIMRLNVAMRYGRRFFAGEFWSSGQESLFRLGDENAGLGEAWEKAGRLRQYTPS
jgi:hypothetical protein